MPPPPPKKNTYKIKEIERGGRKGEPWADDILFSFIFSLFVGACQHFQTAPFSPLSFQNILDLPLFHFCLTCKKPSVKS